MQEGRGRIDGVGACRFFLGTWNMKGFLSEERPIRTLREVLQRLRESYCGTIGYEARTYPGFPHTEHCTPKALHGPPK